MTGNLTLASGFMGQNRLGASNVSIAVDPTNSDRVYVAWGDSNGANSESIHLSRSVNRGVDWQDLLTMTSAMNPEVAIDRTGVVGLLYQGVASGRWQTLLVRSNDPDASTFDTGLLLADQDATSPVRTFSPYIGDYASLISRGDSFFGMFSASNFPDTSRFMDGVSFQREVDWSTHKLFTDATHATTVATSIDPFFFEVENTLCQKSSIYCNICRLSPELCYPIYDPLWWLKCPNCGIHIFLNPGDEIENVSVFDSRGKKVGAVERLREARSRKRGDLSMRRRGWAMCSRQRPEFARGPTADFVPRPWFESQRRRRTDEDPRFLERGRWSRDPGS
ncbi:MAG TPA: hypothetical protein VHJ20_10230 [Polyangia bacterium]|nr:hypothetical protein [Polyangia bacterium]